MTWQCDGLRPAIPSGQIRVGTVWKGVGSEKRPTTEKKVIGRATHHHQAGCYSWRQTWIRTRDQHTGIEQDWTLGAFCLWAGSAQQQQPAA